MENIAKSTSYGCYLDCDFETAKYPDDKTHIVGLLAEYVYDLEQRILHYDERYIKLWNEIETLRECVSKEFDQEQKIADLEAKLAECEKQIKDAREAGNMAVDSWCKNRRKYEAQIAEMQNKSFILYSMLYETLEKQGCDNVASQIDQMTGWTYDKEADWLKGNRNYDQLKQQLAEKDEELKYYETLFKRQCNECKEQDKISFAIDELEKVRETAECVLVNALKNSSLNESYYDRLLDEIDNQIEELRKEMK